MIGRVVSTKMQKTAVVLVEGKKTHPLYNKSYMYSKKYLVDDQLGVKEGDIVEILKIRPISKRKHWKVEKVVGRDFVAMATEELKEEVKQAIAEVLPEEPVESVESVEPVETEKVVEKEETGSNSTSRIKKVKKELGESGETKETKNKKKGVNRNRS